MGRLGLMLLRDTFHHCLRLGGVVLVLMLFEWLESVFILEKKKKIGFKPDSSFDYKWAFIKIAVFKVIPIIHYQVKLYVIIFTDFTGIDRFEAISL